MIRGSGGAPKPGTQLRQAGQAAFRAWGGGEANAIAFAHSATLYLGMGRLHLWAISARGLPA